MHEGLQKELLRSARVCRGPSDVFLQAFLDEPSTEVKKKELVFSLLVFSWLHAIEQEIAH